MFESTIFRKRRIDEQFLRHSEWVRRLGVPLIVSLAGIKSISLMLFIILPFCLTQVAGPSTVFALIFAFIIIFLTGAHLAEISCAMPKNCVHYHFAYSLLGELPAFLVGWLSVLDYLSQASLFSRSWAEHFNLLFRGMPARTLHLTLPTISSHFFTPSLDLLTIVAPIITLSFLMCSLRVVGTICVSLLSVTVLIAASCSLVAFFHVDPQNWLNAGFFTYGYKGVLFAICALCACYTGMESTSCLLEETKNPRKRIASILSFLVVSLTTVFFLLSLVFSLSINVSELKNGTMIPQIFSVLNIPAAKYMLSVCSVCALSGGVLASFLPATRVIAVLCHDRLLPYVRDTSTKSPYFAVLLCTLLVSLSSLVKKEVVLNLVIFLSPIKLIITLVLTYLQHYLPEPIGIPEETSTYRSIGRKRIRVRFDDTASVEQSIEDADESEEETTSRSSIDTTAFLYLKASRLEAERLEKQVARDQEDSPVLSKSVSQYNSMDRPQIKHIHNCVGEQCAKEKDDDNTPDELHLFSIEDPEIPFFSSFPSTPRSQSPSVSPNHYYKSQRYLCTFIALVTLFSIHIRNSEGTKTSNYILNFVLVVIIFLLTIAICKIQTNDYLHKRSSKVPLFPIVSLFPLFILLISFIITLPIYTFLHLTSYTIGGILLYAVYGYRNSKQRNLRCLVISNQNVEQNEFYTPIIDNDTSSEM